MLGGESPFFFLLALYGEEGAGIITVPLPKSQQSDGEADKETENRRCQGQHSTVEAVLVNAGENASNSFRMASTVFYGAFSPFIFGAWTTIPS